MDITLPRVLAVVFVVWGFYASHAVAYQHGVRVGSLEVLASRGCHTDFECEVLVEGG